MEELKIAALQYNIIWENKMANFELIEKELLPEVDEDTELIILPEMFATGFTMNVSAMAENEEGASIKWMKKISRMRNCAICGSMPFKEADKCHNRFVFIANGDLIGSYDKRHLFSYGVEDQHYSPGKEKVIVEWKEWKICLQICYDLRFPVFSRNAEDYDLLIYVASWPDKRIEAWSTLLKARAIENLSYVCGLNRIGLDGSNLNYIGASAIIDHSGKLLQELGNKKGVICQTIQKKNMLAFREKFSFLEDRDQFKIL